MSTLCNQETIITFVAGLFIVQVVTKLLKRSIRQKRPNHSLKKFDTYGMPSTRAGFMFYIVTFLSLTQNITASTILILLSIALLSCSMKYFMSEHSFIQLLAGATLGSVMAFCIVALHKLN